MAHAAAGCVQHGRPSASLLSLLLLSFITNTRAASSGIPRRLPLDNSAIVGAPVSGNRSSLGRPSSTHSYSHSSSSVSGYYCLVEDYPECYYSLGSQYCPSPGSGLSFTDLYMSYLQRTSQVFTNAARMSPSGFRTSYMSPSSVSYACTTATRSPLRYDSSLQQAATQMSVILSNSSCPFQHNTCSGYCWLYGNNCNWWKRIQTYEPNWQSLAENLAMTYTSTAYDPTAALLQWMASSGHCTNIFSSSSTHMGTGATGRYWVQNFAKLSSSSTSSPLYDGSHYSDSTLTSGKLRFLLNYYHATIAPTSVSVVVDGTSHAMSLHLGNTTRGTYYVDRTAPSSSSGCQWYYFQVVNSAGTYTLPETGAYLTATEGTCTSNWDTGRTQSSSSSSSTTAAAAAAAAAAKKRAATTAVAVVVPLVLLPFLVFLAIYIRRRRKGQPTPTLPCLRPSSQPLSWERFTRALSAMRGERPLSNRFTMAPPVKPPKKDEQRPGTPPRSPPLGPTSGSTPPPKPPKTPPLSPQAITSAGELTKPA